MHYENENNLHMPAHFIAQYFAEALQVFKHSFHFTHVDGFSGPGGVVGCACLCI